MILGLNQHWTTVAIPWFGGYARLVVEIKDLIQQIVVWTDKHCWIHLKLYCTLGSIHQHAYLCHARLLVNNRSVSCLDTAWSENENEQSFLNHLILTSVHRDLSGPYEVSRNSGGCCCNQCLKSYETSWYYWCLRHLEGLLQLFVSEIFYVPHIHIGHVETVFERLFNKCMNNKWTKMLCDHMKLSAIISIVVHSFRGIVGHPANCW